MGGNMGGNMGDYSMNYTKTVNHDINPETEEEEETYARARTEAAAAWREHFGREATPEQIRGLAWRSVALGFEGGVLGEAVRLAAIRGAESPFDYVATILRDWNMHGVVTVMDSEKYAADYDERNGKRVGW